MNETENVYKNKYDPLYESILSESVLIGVNPNQPTNKEKPKGILSHIKEEDIFYKGGESIKEPYEPKVGDRFKNLDGGEYEIVVVNNKVTLENEYGHRIYTKIELEDYLKDGQLKKIN